MKIIIAKNYDDMSNIAKYIVLGDFLSKKNRLNVAITAGKTPVLLYEKLIDEVKNKKYLDHIHYYNFDEIPYKVSKREGITISGLRNLYLTPANIKDENIHILDEKNYKTWDNYLLNDGGLDLMILGVGEDGHYCGNLPDLSKFNDRTIKVNVDKVLEDRLSRFYEDKKDIPDFYITMGPRSVMNSKKLIVIASGVSKASAIKEFIEGDNIDKSFPISLLKLHNDITLIIDEDAASLLNTDTKNNI